MKPKNRARSALALLTAIGALATTSESALATPVTYYGAVFDLSIVDVGTTGGVYEVTYTADFTGFTNGGQQPYIDAISWKHAGADVSSVSLVSDPGLGWFADDDSVVNANGCSSSGGQTWACARDYILPYAQTDSLLTWVFHATFSSGTLSSLSTTGDSIKARFVDFFGSKEGALLSCTLDGNSEDNCSTTTTTRVPEPASMTLFGLGLLAFGFVRRRR